MNLFYKVPKPNENENGVGGLHKGASGEPYDWYTLSPLALDRINFLQVEYCSHSTTSSPMLSRPAQVSDRMMTNDD